MATGPMTGKGSNREFHYRLQTLIIDEGTEVLRNIFDNRLQTTLYVFLASNKELIGRLRAQKLVTNTQYDLLFRGRGQNLSSMDFDISLIICLLMKIPSLGFNQNYRWYAEPKSTDVSTEADLCRLRTFRNEIIHRLWTSTLNQSSFEAKWAEVEQVLHRLNQTGSPNPLANLQQKFDMYKSYPIEQWHRIERGLGLTPERDMQFIHDLQNDLILFYKRQYKTVRLSALFEEGLPFLDVYVMPDILSVKVARSRDGSEVQRTPIRKLRDVFYKEGKLCSNIYLTADAGYGKTAFCKRLALTWCHAKQPNERENEYFSQNEIEGIGGFTFVFLLLLGDISSEDDDIDKMILDQLCSQLPHNYNLENLSKVMCEETCLVLLDGLDGWLHPIEAPSFIPSRRIRTNISVLTTTRPWKLCGVVLHSSQIDQKLELTRLSNETAKKLKRAVISHLDEKLNRNEIDSYEAKFNIFVQTNLKSNLTSIPLFLKYFLFVWFYEHNVRTLADNYCSIIELLLSRTVHKDRFQIPKAESVQGNIPPCFNSNTLCKQFYSLLTVLGKLAVHTLLVETKEYTPTFDSSVVKEFLSKDDLTLCFNTGIMTQSKIQGASPLQQKTEVSFADKTLQEFLAALYMSSAPDQKSVKMKCVKDILDMSKILRFIVGINAKSTILHELLNIINEDATVQEYRSSLQDEGFPYQLKDLQDMFVSCCKEIPCENETSLCLQDVFIDNSCREEDYRKNLKQLTTRNKQNIRSVYIDMPDMEDALFDDTTVEVFGLGDLENIEKIFYKGEKGTDSISPLLSSTIKCLSLLCDWPTTGYFSDLLVNEVKSFQTLAVIQISWFKLNHDELSSLLGFISGRDSLREIVLEGLSCIVDNSLCTGHSVDMSRNLSLRELTLYQLPLSKVIVNMRSLHKCCLQYLYNQDLELKFKNISESKLHTFYCGGLESEAAINIVLNTLPDLPHIKHVKLTWINLGTRVLRFNNIEHLQLVRVTMEDSTFRQLLESVPKFHQQVEVHLHFCTILQREEFETVKENMKTSQHFMILVDEENWFEFATKKDGD